MVVFFILWWVVAKFVWPPLVKALDERATKVADGLAAAERGKADLESAKKRAEQALSEARNEGTQRIADAEKRAQLSAEEIKANAQAVFTIKTFSKIIASTNSIDEVDRTSTSGTGRSTIKRN